jgi:hypothetical protein
MIFTMILYCSMSRIVSKCNQVTHHFTNKLLGLHINLAFSRPRILKLNGPGTMCSDKMLLGHGDCGMGYAKCSECWMTDEHKARILVGID